MSPHASIGASQVDQMALASVNTGVRTPVLPVLQGKGDSASQQKPCSVLPLLICEHGISPLVVPGSGWEAQVCSLWYLFSLWAAVSSCFSVLFLWDARTDPAQGLISPPPARCPQASSSTPKGGPTYWHPQNQPCGIPLIPQPLQKGYTALPQPVSQEQHSGTSPSVSHNFSFSSSGLPWAV